MVMRYPPFTTSHAPGSIVPAVSTCMDIAPTILSLAQAVHPNTSRDPRHKVSYKSDTVYPMRGKSWLPYLSSSETSPFAIHADDPLGWEMFGRGALRKGQWKINHMNADDHGKGTWELFDLSKDPGEVTDLAAGMPQKVKELVRDFEVYVKEVGAVWGPPVDMEGPRGKLPEGQCWLQGVWAELVDMVGGDPIMDQRAWMGIGVGKRFSDGAKA